jgi:hypothetical protein
MLSARLHNAFFVKVKIIEGFEADEAAPIGNSAIASP